MDRPQVLDLAGRVVAEIEKAIIGKRKAVELAFIGLLCGGHVLIEDIPGVGKTTLAKALARTIGGTFGRLQFTPDLLPSDITGVNVFSQQTGQFEFRPGPVFHNVLLADEINRGSPKTQASLLECMEEFQVTVDGVTRRVPSPFLVVATENPIEYQGTYPLPEAQLDRFLLRVSIGYPTQAEEIAIVDSQALRHPLETVEQALTPEDTLALRQMVRETYLDQGVKQYAVEIVRQTRSHPAVQLGASPRGSIGLLRAGRARAVLDARDYVIPDDVKYVASAVLAHRLLLREEPTAPGRGQEEVIEEILGQVAVPATRAPAAR
jgi:MoxR-like ATPase